MDKEDIKRARSAAVSFTLDLEEGDRIFDLVSRESGLFVITLKKIVRTKSPDQLDPELEHGTAPWEQSVYLPHGSSDPVVARTVLQTKVLADLLYAPWSKQHRDLMDVGWEVLNSLISLRVIKQRLEEKIEQVAAVIERDIGAYTLGRVPKTLPTVDYYDIEFRSFVNEVRRTLSKISELFLIFTPKDFSQGHFHKALEWSAATYGEKHFLTQILQNDQRWIRLWIAMRVAIEHPEKTKFIETSNFSLEANRQIRLPTWRFVHPDYDMQRPQNLLDVFGSCITNLLGFFEDLQLALANHDSIHVLVEFVEELERDNEAPSRMRFSIPHPATRAESQN